MLSIIIIISLIYFLINSVISLDNNYQININLDHTENDTIILYYNLTTNYSYFLTFRSFESEQLKYGLFFPSNKFQEYSIEIPNQYTTTDIFYLFIICFHFILKINDLDIYCKDIRLFKKNEIKTNLSKDFLPSYNPLFVPMMYALSVLMLLPVIIQHHRRKKALVLQRRKELRRLSVTLSQNKKDPKQNFLQRILSQIIENGNLPMNIELVSAPSTKTILDDIDENDNTNVTFTLQNLQPFTHTYDENNLNEESVIDAHDCIAHLLDNTPWNTPHNDQPLSTSLSQRHSVIRDCTTVIKEQHVPITISFHDDDDDDDRKPILKPTKYSTSHFYRTNQNFVESDV